ncbi:MAG: hypothetical protein RIR18_2369 [Pseudomonadota bacterium]
MQKTPLSTIGFAAALLVLAVSAPVSAASLQEAAELLGAAKTTSIEFNATGKWFQFGQAPNPTQAWPQFDVNAYRALINFDQPAARVQISRLQTIVPERVRPQPVEQRVDQRVSSGVAWSLAPNGSVTAQLAAVEERLAEIWSTPQGFVKAALEHHGKSEAFGQNKVQVTFSVHGKYRYVGVINEQNQLESVQTWIDSPVLGDTLFETKYSDYKDFGGVKFPAQITRNQGGFPVLDLQVSSVSLNPALTFNAPVEAGKADVLPPVNVVVNKLSEGVYYLTGGTHHSVAIEQKDHVILVEAPLNEARSEALIAKIKETIPGKPIKYLVNTHHHFDHSGGLRTFVDAGASIVTHQLDKAYYEKIWGQSHALSPDQLSKSSKRPNFVSFTDKHVLSDGKRSVEVHTLAGSGHADGFAFVYLPAEKILIEADAYTPLPANVSPPIPANPYSVNLYENIQRLNLNVERIAALHGPKVVTLDDLRAYIGIAK